MKNLTKKVFAAIVVGAFVSSTMFGCAASRGQGKSKTNDKPGKIDTIAMHQETDDSISSATNATL